MPTYMSLEDALGPGRSENHLRTGCMLRGLLSLRSVLVRHKRT